MKTRKELEARKEAFEEAMKTIRDYNNPEEEIKPRIDEIEHTLEERS